MTHARSAVALGDEIAPVPGRAMCLASAPKRAQRESDRSWPPRRPRPRPARRRSWCRAASAWARPRSSAPSRSRRRSAPRRCSRRRARTPRRTRRPPRWRWTSGGYASTTTSCSPSSERRARNASGSCGTTWSTGRSAPSSSSTPVGSRTRSARWTTSRRTRSRSSWPSTPSTERCSWTPRRSPTRCSSTPRYPWWTATRVTPVPRRAR